MPAGSFFPNRTFNRWYIRGRCRLSIVHSRMRLWGKIPNGWIGGGKKRMRIHATGGAYLNSRLTFIYLATFNFYGRDPADSLDPAGSSRCVVPGTPGAPGAWYNIRGRAAPLNWGVPRVAIRRTRASKTRRKSYLWGKRETEEVGIYCAVPRAEIHGFAPAGTIVESMGFDQIKRVVFFIHPGIPRNSRSDDENGRLSGRFLKSTNCPLFLLFFSLWTGRVEGEEK